jgi:hypothetical protein
MEPTNLTLFFQEIRTREIVLPDVSGPRSSGGPPNVSTLSSYDCQQIVNDSCSGVLIGLQSVGECLFASFVPARSSPTSLLALPDRMFREGGVSLYRKLWNLHYMLCELIDPSTPAYYRPQLMSDQAMQSALVLLYQNDVPARIKAAIEYTLEEKPLPRDSFVACLTQNPSLAKQVVLEVLCSQFSYYDQISSLNTPAEKLSCFKEMLIHCTFGSYKMLDELSWDRFVDKLMNVYNKLPQQYRDAIFEFLGDGKTFRAELCETKGNPCDLLHFIRMIMPMIDSLIESKNT